MGQNLWLDRKTNCSCRPTLPNAHCEKQVPAVMPLSLYLRGLFPACRTFVLSETALLQQHSTANRGLCHPPLAKPTGTTDRRVQPGNLTVCQVVWEFCPSLALGMGMGLAGTLFTLKMTKIKMTEVEPLCQHPAETNIRKQHLSLY